MVSGYTLTCTAEYESSTIGVSLFREAIAFHNLHREEFYEQN